MTENYFDPADLIQLAESMDPSAVAQTTDYNDSNLLTPGRYNNAFREIVKTEPKTSKDGVPYVSITLKLTGGLEVGEGRVFGQTYPFLAWINTLPRQAFDGPGTTTSLAEYMKSAGFEVSGVPTKELLLQLPESVNYPVGVRVGLKDKGSKGSDGKWSSDDSVKTKDFNQGSKKEPKWVFSIQKDGKTITAANNIEGFSKVVA